MSNLLFCEERRLRFVKQGQTYTLATPKVARLTKDNLALALNGGLSRNSAVFIIDIETERYSETQTLFWFRVVSMLGVCWICCLR